jgi:hypothetical protein
MRVAAQDAGEQCSPAAADVDDGADVGEVVAGGYGPGERRGPLGHRGVKDGCVLRMLGQEFEQVHPVGGVKSGLAGSDRVQDVFERPAASGGAVQQGPRSH